MKETYPHEEFGDIDVIHSLRAKTLRIQIGGQGIRLVIPKKITTVQGIEFVNSKKDWISKALTRIEKKTQHIQADITSLKTITFTVSIQATNRTNLLFSLKDTILLIEYPQNIDLKASTYQQKIKDGIEKFVLAEAKRYLPQRVALLATKHGFRYNEVTIRRTKQRWGSCSSKKNINLSAYLMLVPNYLADYVILHELCHTKHMNHGSNFWKAMENVSDNYLALRKELKSYSHLVNLF